MGIISYLEIKSPDYIIGTYTLRKGKTLKHKVWSNYNNELMSQLSGPPLLAYLELYGNRRGRM